MRSGATPLVVTSALFIVRCSDLAWSFCHLQPFQTSSASHARNKRVDWNASRAYASDFVFWPNLPVRWWVMHPQRCHRWRQCDRTVRPILSVFRRSGEYTIPTHLLKLLSSHDDHFGSGPQNDVKLSHTNTDRIVHIANKWFPFMRWYCTLGGKAESPFLHIPLRLDSDVFVPSWPTGNLRKTSATQQRPPITLYQSELDFTCQLEFEQPEVTTWDYKHAIFSSERICPNWN